MILGLVRWMQPVHGYDVRRELLSWSADKWANVQPGSIYHALRKLTEEGLLREVATEQVGARPARTTYAVTAQGRGRVRDPAARALVGAAPRRSTRSWRRSRSCRPCRARRRRRRCATGPACCGPVPSRHAQLLEAGLGGRTTSRCTSAGCSSCGSAGAEAEVAWCERIAERIESGVSVCMLTSSRPRDGAVWRESMGNAERSRVIVTTYSTLTQRSYIAIACPRGRHSLPETRSRHDRDQGLAEVVPVPRRVARPRRSRPCAGST